MFSRISKIFPKRLRNAYKKQLLYNQIETDPDKFMGFAFIIGLVGVAAVLINVFILLSINLKLLIPGIIIGYLAFEGFIYIWLSYSADAKARDVERILPDALNLMAMNLKAGMTTDKALIVSARPEFGILEKQILKAGKQLLAGRDIKSALSEIPKNINSRTLEKTVNLIIQGVESGGTVAELLRQASDDIQNKRLIEDEVRANVMMYAIFIFFAVGIGAPLLFGISTHLVQTLSTQFSQFDVQDVNTGSIKIGQGSVNIGPNFLLIFAILMLVVNSFFGSMIIGVVKGSSPSESVKIFPVLVIIALGVFFGVRFFVGNIFAGL